MDGSVDAHKAETSRKEVVWASSVVINLNQQMPSRVYAEWAEGTAIPVICYGLYERKRQTIAKRERERWREGEGRVYGYVHKGRKHPLPKPQRKANSSREAAPCCLFLGTMHVQGMR